MCRLSEIALLLVLFTSHRRIEASSLRLRWKLWIISIQESQQHSTQSRELAKRERNRYNWDISLPLNSNLFKFTCHSRSALSHLGPRSFLFLPTHSIYRAIVLCSSHSTAIVSATTAVSGREEEVERRGRRKEEMKICCVLHAKNIFPFSFATPSPSPHVARWVSFALKLSEKKRDFILYFIAPHLVVSHRPALLDASVRREFVDDWGGGNFPYFFFSHKQQQHSKWDEERRQ